MKTTFDTAMQPISKPKPAPEPAAYGLVFLIITLVIVGHFLARRRPS
jgi:hypothetical protein